MHFEMIRNLIFSNMYLSHFFIQICFCFVGKELSFARSDGLKKLGSTLFPQGFVSAGVILYEINVNLYQSDLYCISFELTSVPAILSRGGKIKPSLWSRFLIGPWNFVKNKVRFFKSLWERCSAAASSLFFFVLCSVTSSSHVSTNSVTSNPQLRNFLCYLIRAAKCLFC